MSKIALKYYRVKPNSQSHLICETNQAAIQAKLFEMFSYVQRTFGTNDTIVQGNHNSLYAVRDTGKAVPGMKPSKVNPGYIVPDATKEGRAIRRKWKLFETPDWSTASSFLGLSMAISWPHILRPEFFNYASDWYVSAPAPKRKHKDLILIRESEFIRAREDAEGAV